MTHPDHVHACYCMAMSFFLKGLYFQSKGFKTRARHSFDDAAMFLEEAGAPDDCMVLRLVTETLRKTA